MASLAPTRNGRLRGGYLKGKPVRVFCCYTTLNPKTEQAILSYAPETEFVNTTGDYGYFDFFKEQWNGESDIVIIEQDIEIGKDTIPSFRDCPELWCVFSYQGSPRMGHLSRSLGCTRFSAKVQQRIPNLFSSNLVRRYIPCPIGEYRVFWQNIDRFIWTAFSYEMGDDAPSHVHGAVTHHHRYSMDSLPEFAVENTPDGKSERTYRVNPDGTRGTFISEVRKFK